MSSKSDKYTRRRLRSSYVSVVVSISLVLLVLGAFGTLLIGANRLANFYKENFAVSVLLKNESSEVAVRQFQKTLELSDYIKSTEFISKEEAAENLKEELDEDFLEFLGYNPLQNSIDIKLYAEYVTPEQLATIEKDFEKNEFVSEVVYDKPLIELMNSNIEKIGVYMLIGLALLALVSIGLINSSIRLSIYSRRFLIKTMQLVGATKGFIRRPFIWRSFRHGLYGSFIAIALLGGLFYYTNNTIPDLNALGNPLYLAILGGGIILAGIFISMLCTFFALRKYLKLKTDQLYY